MMRFQLFIVIAAMSVTAVGAAIRPDRNLQVRFLAESLPADLGQIALVTADSRTEPFDLPMNNLSSPQNPPARVFNVWDVDKKTSLAKVTLPEEGQSFIALLIPSPKGGFLPIVMRSDDPAFGPGDIYFLNLTDRSVLGFVGSAKFVLKSGRNTILRPKGARSEKFYDVGLGVREKEGDRVLVQTRWPEDDQARFYVFFYVNQETKRITYRAVDEFVGKAVNKP